MAMAAAPVRVSLSSNRHLLHSLFRNPSFHTPLRQTRPTSTCTSHFQFPSLSLHHSHPKSPPFNPFHIFSASQFSTPNNLFDPIFFGLDHNSSHWNFASCPKSLNNGIFAATEGKDPEVVVVLLGWLGAKRKHLRRYVELYNERGFHAVTFVASVMDVLSFDLGKKLEERIHRLSHELTSWLSSNESGRERFLIFHTFSNTGWLAYGAIIDNLRGRQDLLDKVRGCVVDSGGDPNIDPKVWAAGFTAALLKKSSSATYASTETGKAAQLGSEINRSSEMEEKKPILMETLLLFAFEKLFSYLLNLPDINRRVRKTISVLSVDQPPCPQLYLYSTGDKVIPFQAVDSFIEDQRRLGKQVFSFNFGSSPHVDHYRTFPGEYASQLLNFLKECFVTI